MAAFRTMVRERMTKSPAPLVPVWEQPDPVAAARPFGYPGVARPLARYFFMDPRS